MGILYFLADSFIAAFGITRPTDQARTRAAWFILGLMMLVLAGVAGAAFAIHAALR